MIQPCPRSTSTAVVIGLVLTLAATPARAWQDEDAGTRAWFVGSRPPVAKPAPKPPPRRKPRPGTTKPAATKTPAPKAAAGIGLGYTIFKEVVGRPPVRVAPGTVFATGDAVRLVVETNRDGYLYIFVAENGANPELLYPDARLASGANFVAAHQPTEVPSSRNPAFPWFRFGGEAATEHVYVVFSTKTLPGVPTEDDLVQYYESYKRTWRPDEAVWDAVAAASLAPRTSSTAPTSAAVAQSVEEREALTREMTLSAGAAAPAVVEADRVSTSNVFVTRILFPHK